MNSSSRGTRGPLRARPLKGSARARPGQQAGRGAGLSLTALGNTRNLSTVCGLACSPGVAFVYFNCENRDPGYSAGRGTSAETPSPGGRARPPPRREPTLRGSGRCAAASVRFWKDGRVPSRVRGQMLLAMFGLLTCTRGAGTAEPAQAVARVIL